MCLQVTSADGGQEVGKIAKQWGGLAREMITNADNYAATCKRVYSFGLDRVKPCKDSYLYRW